MNKFMKVLAASALVATALTGCGSKAKFAKAGLGVVTSMGHYNPAEVNTTFAGIALDSDGKIQWIDVDVAQGVPGDSKQEFTKTKKEKKDEYNMRNASSIKKEWFEQIAAFEQQCIGKTPDEVAKFAVDGEGKPTDADVKAGCSMAITDFQKAVANAAANAQEVNAEKVTLGRVMSYESDTYQAPWTYLTTDLALVSTDADGKIVGVDLETSKNKNDGSNLETKTALKEKYDMKKASPIQKEWFEQVAYLESKLIGKTVDEAAKLALGADGKPTDADIKTGCTIVLTQFEAALAKAK